MRSRIDSRCPGKNRCLLYIHSAISRVRTPDGALSSKAPDVALVRLENIKLIDPPVVGLGQFKWSGRIGCKSHRCSSSGIVHLVKIIAEVHIV